MCNLEIFDSYYIVKIKIIEKKLMKTSKNEKKIMIVDIVETYLIHKKSIFNGKQTIYIKDEIKK